MYDGLVWAGRLAVSGIVCTITAIATVTLTSRTPEQPDLETVVLLVVRPLLHSPTTQSQ